ncbi:MAG TPA: endonuclease/exonuclease/phosphatase family protein [Acidimicrobiia bacterium]|nr:endonuclease/exonuclease/phosphatase family protein [Acidimicrobiia bacterium]
MILVVIPALLVAAASVAGHAGAWWWMLDLFSNFRPQYAVAGVLLGLGLFVGRWRKTGGAVLTIGLVDAALVGMLWLAPSATPAPTGEEITVMSFNVWASNESMDAVFDYVRRVGPDVVFLHETTYLWEEAAMAADLGYEVHTAGQRGLIFSTLVLAPEGAAVESYGFATAEPRAIEVVLDDADRTTRILGLHPISPITSERAALRNAQMRWAVEWVRAADGPVIVTGDLNTTQFSHAWRTLVRETGLLDSTRGFGLQPSFPMNGNPLVRVQIDHLLHSDHFVTLDRTLGPRLGSDHAPLIVRLAPAG